MKGLPMPANRLMHALALTTLLACGGAMAQEPPPSRPAPPALPPLPAIAGSLSAPAMQFIVGELDGKVVKGAPYTAEAASETVQVLADGNRIVRRHASRLARDGEGRTRQERVVDGKVASVLIHDPVAGKSWSLSPEAKRARELPARDGPPVPPPAASADEMRSWADAMRAWAREFGQRFGSEPLPVPPAAPSVQRIERGDGTVEVQVRVVEPHRAGATASVPNVRAPVPPPVPMPPMFAPPPGEGVTTSLGAREFDGVRADGTRTTWTIPAGRIGNEKPIEIVSERWYAPELMLVVSTRRSDPRSGETSYRLTNLKRGEPDAALFRVPADYELRPRDRRGDPAERK
jgi:hypothetical protein